MTFSVWLSLLAACVVISLTPGAGAINTMTNALTEGWRRSIWGILGQQVGLLTHIAIVAAGVGLLVSRSPVLFGVIRYAGAAYLVYLGVRLMLVKTDAAAEDDADPGAGTGAGSGAGADTGAGSGAGADADATDAGPVRVRESAWSMARRGFWVNLLNPKSIVFFLAFIPQFVRLDEPALPQYLVLAATCVVVDVTIMWGGFAAAARSFRRLTATPRGRRTLNTVFGVLFILVAVLLVFVH